MEKTIAVIGTGYVGLSTAAILSNVGFTVYTVDVDESKINTLKKGKSHFFEIGMDSFVKKGIESKKLIPTLNHEEALENADIVFSCVGTPDLPDGSPNLEYIFQVADSLASHAKNNVIFVQKSTVPVGTGKQLIHHIEKQNPKLSFSYVSNPEFLREGSAVFDTLNMDRLVLGSNNEKARKTLIDIFKQVDEFSKTVNQDDFIEYAKTYVNNLNDDGSFENRVIESNIESAELIKVTANAFLALKISFANSIALLCEKTDAQINEVMDGIGADRRISRSFLYAGLGWGGGCFPKDVSGLISTSESFGVTNPIMNGAVEINTRMIQTVLEKVKKLNKNRISILGLAFKPGTSDVRKSQSIKLANLLAEKGYSVKAFDPQAMHEAKEDLSERVQIVDSIETCMEDTEVIIVATEWNEFKKYNWSQISKEITIIDARNALDKEELKKLGFSYQGIGQR